jgi:uncharacterized protein YbjT (DUF2867 family)
MTNAEANANHERKPVLVTGASGYIGGRLVSRLLAAGHRVRCLAREPRKLDSHLWVGDTNVEVVRCDVSDRQTLADALNGCGPAYYLVHSMMAAGPAYRERDRMLATMFAEEATEARLDRIVYLGGLGETGKGLSDHLASRREVEAALASGSVRR